MTTKDLMIGDYVTFKDCQNDDAPSIVKIEGLGYQGRGVVEEALITIDDDEYGFDLVEIDDEFVGIPLTGEILKKNGFKDGQYFSELYIQGWHVISDANNLCMECERGWHMNIPCRCVHELQHAFNLVGINKDFVV